jgi:hypothetical protein
LKRLRKRWALSEMSDPELFDWGFAYRQSPLTSRLIKTGTSPFTAFSVWSV